MPITTPIQTIKFSQMTPGGDIANNDQVPGLLSGGNVLFNNPWTFLPPGSTADRPPPSTAINYRLRFNTDDQLYEYYDAVLGQWTQLQENTFTVGPFVTYTSSDSLPDAFNLGTLASGILKQTVTTGVSTPNIAVNGVDYYGPGFTGYFQSPAGVKDISGNIIMGWNTAGPTAVNYPLFLANVSGYPVAQFAEGADTNIDYFYYTKGNGAHVLISQNPTLPFIIYNGTLGQHSTNFLFSNTAITRNVTFQDADGTVAFLSDIPSQVLNWVPAPSSPITAAINTGYYITDASQVTITLPTTAPAGSLVAVVGYGAGGWILQPGIGQTIKILTQSASTSITSAEAFDCIEVICVVANTTWVARSSITTGFTVS
jgi:hypothetical protein